MAKPKEDVRTLYMCGVAWQHDLEGRGFVKVYASKEECERDKKCTDECGIVEIEVRVKRWVKEKKI